MDVIMNKEVMVPSITSLTYMSGENGVAVSTRVPAKLISFSAGESIYRWWHWNETRRRRRNLAADGSIKIDKKASYEVKVNLARQMISDEEVLISSATLVTTIGMGFVSFLPVIVYAMW